MALTTTGWNRISNATSVALGSITLQATPFAQVYVTSTASGGAATIYSDPLLSIAVPGSLVTADGAGNYSYYLPLNYCVTETVTAPNEVGTVIIPNIVQNGPIVASLTTTANTSDTVNITGVLSTSHVALTATNSTAAALLYTSPGVYVTVAGGSVTVHHPATASGTFSLLITPY